MEKQETLIARYQVLVSEWNTISIICSILFSSAILGLVLGLIYFNLGVVFITLLLMFAFATFEYRSRRIYVETKRLLEEEILKFSGIKKEKMKEMVNKGLIW